MNDETRRAAAPPVEPLDRASVSYIHGILMPEPPPSPVREAGLREALDEQRLYAKYSGARTHGVHVNDDTDCREYVIGQCFIDAALLAGPVPLNVERLRAALHEAGIGCKPNVPYCRATHRGHAERIAEKYAARLTDPKGATE